MRYSNQEWLLITNYGKKTPKEELVSAMRQEALEFFLKIQKTENSFLYCAIEREADTFFMEAFYEVFGSQLSAKTSVGSHSGNQKYLLECLLSFGYFRKNVEFMKLYANDSKIMLINNKTPKLEALTLNYYFNTKIDKDISTSFALDYYYMQLLHFKKIAGNNAYHDYFMVCLESTQESHASFLKSLQFYEKPIEDIMQYVEIDDLSEFQLFQDKKYKEIILNNPVALTKVSPNLENTKAFLSFISDKKAYLDMLYQGRNKNSLYKLKEKGLSNSSAPILYAAITENVEFINFMLDYGYELDEREKLYIKQHNLTDKITHFQDSVMQNYQNNLSKKNEEEKAYYLFKMYYQEKITEEDFNYLFNKIDLNKVENKHYGVLHAKTSYEDMIGLYIKHSASVIDILLKKDNVKPLIEMDIQKLSSLQKKYLLRKVTSHMQNFGFFEEKDKFNYTHNLDRLKTHLYSDIISLMYESFAISDRGYFSLPDDFFLSTKIEREELLNNKDIFKAQSIPMTLRLLEEGEILEESEKNTLFELFGKKFNYYIGRQDQEEQINLFIDLIVKTSSFYEDFPEKLKKKFAKKEELKEFFIKLDKEVLNINIKVLSVQSNPTKRI